MQITPPEIYVKDTGTEKGRGVFATKDISEGDIVESCPVILFVLPSIPVLEGRQDTHPLYEIKNNMFHWGFLIGSQESDSSFRLQAIALGYGSMYNHNNPANMRYEADTNTRTLRFVADRNIYANEELTINYSALGGGALSPDNNWFDKRNIKPIINN
jgi:uncharacterized protein